MAHSYTTLLYHIIFATKNREAWLGDELRPVIYAQMGGIVEELGGVTIRINGMSDHVHLLVRLRPDHRLCDILRDVKARTSGWIHRKRPDLASFWWQTGYGAFTVSDSLSSLIRQYIDDQEQHHRHSTVEQEFLRLYCQHGVEVDRQTLWD